MFWSNYKNMGKLCPIQRCKTTENQHHIKILSARAASWRQHLNSFPLFQESIWCLSLTLGSLTCINFLWPNLCPSHFCFIFSLDTTRALLASFPFLFFLRHPDGATKWNKPYSYICWWEIKYRLLLLYK